MIEFFQIRLRGFNLLVQFRQLSQLFGRPLLAMLLFVWLTMALAPCVMANPVSFSELTQVKADRDIEMSVLHAKMENCAYCPEENNGMGTLVLCQSTHGNISDIMNFMVDSIDAEALVLFEIPASLLINPLIMNNIAADFLQFRDTNTLSPLALTGILRI